MAAAKAIQNIWTAAACKMKNFLTELPYFSIKVNVDRDYLRALRKTE
jgi:hypothetical protein